MTRHTTLSPILVITPVATAQKAVTRLVNQKLPNVKPSQVIWLCPPDQMPTLEQLREWLYGLSYRLGPDEYRVGVVPGLNHAPVELSHTLLKTLEEPPERTLILLTVESSHGLLTTLVSRCQTHFETPTDLDPNAEPDPWLTLATQLTDCLPASSVYSLWSPLPKTLTSMQAILLLSHLTQKLLPWRMTSPGRQMLQAVLVATSQLEQNAHVRLTVENCLLQLYLLAKAVKTAPRIE